MLGEISQKRLIYFFLFNCGINCIFNILMLVLFIYLGYGTLAFIFFSAWLALCFIFSILMNIQSAKIISFKKFMSVLTKLYLVFLIVMLMVSVLLFWFLWVPTFKIYNEFLLGMLPSAMLILISINLIFPLIILVFGFTKRSQAIVELDIYD